MRNLKNKIYVPVSGILLINVAVALLCVSGCQTTRGNQGNIQKPYLIPVEEVAWIRNGEPIEFEGQMWYPADGVESFLDTEMLYLGEYRGVAFFADRVDVRPIERLYTKFDKNKFRFFEKKTDDDSN